MSTGRQGKKTLGIDSYPSFFLFFFFHILSLP